MTLPRLASAASPSLPAVAVTFNPASVPGSSTSDQAVAVPGAVAGCGVLVIPPSGVAAGVGWTAWGSGADQVTVRFTNPTLTAVDLPSGTWTFRLAK